MKVSVAWQGKKRFDAKGDSGHLVVMDAKKEIGGEDSGSRPMELLLMGLGGCTGIDIVMILEKMRLNLEEFHMEIEGDRREEHPQKFTDIRIKYILKGEGLTRDKVERAIRLSEEKYCSASASLNARIQTVYELNGVLYEMGERTDNHEDPLQ
ncbi:OsmC family protein [Effusibacillus lacus]|uniref:Peroxiredoxin n=1 Tax=Effusibacillus lacus TaxID=1348429 RepID=A0A292YMM9_9BACL|nr:OsmC family protein [Effusibacillus lacus]TCS75292.1 putative redox protein [Effusibacillus lacus]GAX89730.1 peroxiredoxin [Effusibacillus lacus]